MGTQIQTILKISEKNACLGTSWQVSSEQCFFLVLLKLKTLLLFILKFNVNVTIPIPSSEECGPRLVKTPDWSNHQIPVSDWLIDIPNASRQDQNSFLTGKMLQKENSNANSTLPILDSLLLYKDCNRDKK